MLSSLKPLLAAALLLKLAGADGDVCSRVANHTTIAVAQPWTLDWTTQQTEYWSTACSNLKPSCILFPTSAAEVSAIVRELNNGNESFAIKSGGHNSNVGYASIDGGPLISMARMNQVILDRTTETVRLGPGNRWDEVAKKLDGTGYSVVGGRIGNVGVGGYMLGGGLSFMSVEYGWAANSIVEFELVLANATVVNVNQNNYPDLFKALKGGGNAFGIVTTFVVRAHLQGEVWGGNYFFNSSESTDAALVAAVAEFTANYPDPKAGIILTADRAGAGLLDFWTMFLFYDGPSPPDNVFAAFKKIGPTSDTTKTRTFSDLVSWNNWAVVRGSVYTIGTETIPVPQGSSAAAVMQDVHRHWRNVSGTVLPTVQGLIATTAYQPVPRGMAKAARASNGGDLLDLDESNDLIVIEYNYSFLFDQERPAVDAAMQATYGGVRDRVQAFTKDGTLPAGVYLPLFANDLYNRQDYFGRLKPENKALAMRVRDSVDPTRLFADRTKGMKM